ncbi:ceramide glucosyltransferase [Biomphalaria pfeifferi]|uniref:ceramide glucosyltransferase n=1 Tax=Biomphalaria pfeifferi TaxID=112525 RepID=A0AAD8AWZ0_BIOPF|nr:ceramide glucosyltransferase [Biomphalaria pfeifferi]
MVQNMAPAYEAARYEFVWISSSRIEASDAILNDMISKLQILNVALVHQMPYITGGHGFGSNVEKIYFGAFHAKFYIAFNILGFICVTGMSYMFKKTLLDQVNGLAWYGRYLAEDYFLTTALHERGRLVMSAYPAKQNVGQTTLRGFADRQIRWSKLRLNMMPLVEVLESFSYCSHLGIISALTLHHFLAINPYNFFLAHVLLWIILDYIILSYIENELLLLSKFEFLKCWLVRELSATYILVVALLNPHIIKWHHRTFRVHLGGLTEHVKDV